MLNCQSYDGNGSMMVVEGFRHDVLQRKCRTAQVIGGHVDGYCGVKVISHLIIEQDYFY